MARGPSPQLGYNTNLRHKGKLYHVQTEDSGVAHPHVMTHLFADGGRIVDSRKTGYSEHVGAANLQEIVKKLMQAQHKAMCIALRDGKYDADAAVVAHGAAGAAKPEGAARPDAEPHHANSPLSETRVSSTGARAARKATERASRAPTARASQPPERSVASRAVPSKRPSSPRVSRVPGKRGSSPRVPRPPIAPAQSAPKAQAAAPGADIDAFERAAEARLAESKLTRAPVRRRPMSTPLGRLTRPAASGKKLEDAILAYLDEDEKGTKGDA